MNDRGIIPSYLFSPLSNITNPENTSQIKIVKDSNSKIVNDLLIHNTIPVSLFNNLLTFRIDITSKYFELNADFLKMIANNKHNVDLAILVDKKLLCDFAKEMYFDVEAPGKKSTRARTLIRLLKSPRLMISTSGNSNTIFLLSDPNEICDRLNLLLLEKQAGNNSDIINEEITPLPTNLFQTSYSNETLHSYLVEPLKSQVYHYLLTVDNVFTKYLFAVPLTNVRVDTNALQLTSIFFQHSSMPKTIYSDPGTSFVSEIKHELTKKIYNSITTCISKTPRNGGRSRTLSKRT